MYNIMWDDLCALASQHRDSKSDEDSFQQDIEAFFERLGWSKRDGEIISHEQIPFGAANILVPDISLRVDNKTVVVIELKRPCIGLSDDNVLQLFSYMLSKKLHLGLLIGDEIRLYYDDYKTDNPQPTLAMRCSLSPGDEDGVRLVSLLSKKSFSTDSICRFCEQSIHNSQVSLTIVQVSDAKAVSDDEISAREFWERFKSYCKENGHLPELYRYAANNTQQFGVNVARDVSDYRLFLKISKHAELFVGIIAYSDDSLGRLFSKIDLIESQYGEILDWHFNECSKQKTIHLVKANSDAYRRDLLQQNIDWLVDSFYRLLSALKAAYPESF